MSAYSKIDTRAHRAHYRGLFFDEMAADSAWIREKGRLALPPVTGTSRFTLHGHVLPAPKDNASVGGNLGLKLRANGAVVVALPTIASGPFSLTFTAPAGITTDGLDLTIELVGAGFTNFLAWLGRITKFGPLQPYRKQARNRRLRIDRLEADGEIVFDFSQRASAYSAAFARRHIRLGLNLVGFFTADLGIGESVRCAAKSSDAAKIPTALVDLKLNCKNSRSDLSFANRLQPDNPHPVNVFHLDAPQSSEIDHHQGPHFRRNKYNIAYWAWELPEFPDTWIPQTQFFDEIWTPSAFVRDAISAKVPLPVLPMPHAIEFARPQGDFRPRCGLPSDKFLFLFIFDLNSYAARKNPQAVLAAYKKAYPHPSETGLVIKVHNIAGNESEFESLQNAAKELPNTFLITDTLARDEVYQLQSACDCFVSLHRAEGFGFALAESMFLNKPVIATNWSGTTEFVDATNGAPVNYRLVTLDRNYGPYSKGQTWAEADIDHAAWWMKKLHADRALASRLGAAGRATIEEKFSPAAIGARYRRRLESIASW